MFSQACVCSQGDVDWYAWSQVPSRVGMSRGGMSSWGGGGHGTWDTHPLVLTPSDSHQNTYSWQAGGTHYTEMLYCYIQLNEN